MSPSRAVRRSPLVNRSTASLALVAALAASGCVSEAGESADADPLEFDVDEIDLDVGDIDLDLDDPGPGDLEAGDLEAGEVSLAAAAGAELTDDENRCLDRGAIDVLGTDRFIELSRAGEFGADVFLEPGEADEVADLFFDCVDASDFLQRTFASDPAFAQLPVEFVDCILGEIDPSVLRSGLAATFSGADATGAAMEEVGAQAGLACIDVLTPEQLEDLADL